jgi:hypothetical protein
MSFVPDPVLVLVPLWVLILINPYTKFWLDLIQDQTDTQTGGGHQMESLIFAKVHIPNHLWIGTRTVAIPIYLFQLFWGYSWLIEQFWSGGRE